MKVGLQYRAYLNQWTLTGEAGGVSRSHRGGTYYAEAIVNWYAKPDWKLYLGGIVLDNKEAGQIGTEYQLGLRSLDVIAKIWIHQH